MSKAAVTRIIVAFHVATIGAVLARHVANFILLNVQFYIYPIAFLTFFDMAPFARWVRKRARQRFGSATEVTA